MRTQGVTLDLHWNISLVDVNITPHHDVTSCNDQPGLMLISFWLIKFINLRTMFALSSKMEVKCTKVEYKHLKIAVRYSTGVNVLSCNWLQVPHCFKLNIYIKQFEHVASGYLKLFPLQIHILQAKQLIGWRLKKKKYRWINNEEVSRVVAPKAAELGDKEFPLVSLTHRQTEVF